MDRGPAPTTRSVSCAIAQNPFSTRIGSLVANNATTMSMTSRIAASGVTSLVLEELSEELLYLALGRSERAPASGSDAIDPATSGAGPLHRGLEVAFAL
jgi:hypothetical protein